MKIKNLKVYAVVLLLTFMPVAKIHAQLMNIHLKYPTAQFERWDQIRNNSSSEELEEFKSVSRAVVDRLGAYESKFESSNRSARAKLDMLEELSVKLWKYGEKSDLHFMVVFDLVYMISEWAQPVMLCLAIDCE